MDYLNIILFGIILFIVIRKFLPTKGVRQITTVDLKNELKDRNKKQFIDVRTPSEFNGNNIRGFKNIPLHQLAQKVESLSKESDVVLICQSGMRSNKASKLLVKKGFKQITNVKGGMSAWT